MAVVRLQLAPNTTNAVGLDSESDFYTQIERAGLQGVPVNAVAIAELLGLVVRHEVMQDDLSGYLERRGNSWVVGVNSYHHPNRQRFSVAHEIAHYVLHRGQQSKFVDSTFARRTGASSDPMEKEADRFAAKLLMPEKNINRLFDSGMTSIQDLASHFGVSSLAMQYRVQELGYSVA